jgi:hypothetical protein
MSINGHKTCEFTDEIVAYLYNEIGDGERAKFETHIASCGTCTDEFAAVSNARFSVFEWRKEQFDSLATPHIVIPELAKQTKADISESGWLAALAGLLSFARSPMAVATALLVCIGVGFIVLTYFRSSESLIASNKIDVPVVKNTELENAKPVIDPIVETETPTDQPIEPTRISTPQKSTPAYKTVPATEAKRAVNNDVKRTRMTQTAQKPALNDFREEADNSLRLTDLFDEIGG